ncbi:MAG: [FeFe] hydrogenase, group A [Coriobacteriia bacterium]|nr:[FeFe] hydrogenase, group A [Coriobacteriia bacterium]
MVNIKINDNAIKAKDGSTILEVARANNIDIPTLCEYEELNCIGACRICMVEVLGFDRLVAACNTVVEPGMNILTDSAKVRDARKKNMQLILSEHNTDCTKCVRNNNCKLQDLSEKFNIQDNPYGEKYRSVEWPKNFPLQRDESKCVKCMRCIQVCDNIQGIHVWDVRNHGTRTSVGIRDGVKIDETKCVLCGQCITHCPVGALVERDDIQKVYDAIENPDITTIVQVAPAVRTAWAEELGLDRKKATPRHMVAALKKLGFDYVFDTDWSADLTIMEEGTEFLNRLKHKKDYAWPMFTSCCPAWVRYLKGHRPDQVKQLSSAKSPQQMFGPAAKELLSKTAGLKKKDIFCVSIMPCVAKKYECGVPQMKDVECSLTVREFQRMMKTAGIKPSDVKPCDFDSPLGEATGAAHIFGATGGVMEAALRTAYAIIMGKNPPADLFKGVRGMDGWKEAEFTLKGNKIRVAVVHGLVNAEKLLQAIDKGEVEYDFVEVMTCPGGCAGGGGQPIKDQCEQAKDRGKILYFLDKREKSRFSHENKSVQKIYKDIYGKPLSKKSHNDFHTDQRKWDFQPH